MTDDEVTRRIIDAYEWHRALGNRQNICRFGSLIHDTDNPDVWSANHVSGITASSDDEIDELLAEVDANYRYCRHRCFQINKFTPERFVARLIMDDFEELSPTLQMLLMKEPPERQVANLKLLDVVDEDDWLNIRRMVRLDHNEGARTHRTKLPEAVTEGIVSGFRRKSGPSHMVIATIYGEPCAYGAIVDCANGMGMIEDLYTIPKFRGRGIASSIIRHGIARLRSEDRDRQIFLGAHAREKPKFLYRSLGFYAWTVTREFVNIQK